MMQKSLVILLLFVVTIGILFLLLALISRSGTTPGLIDNKLTPCPKKPNCVCSEYIDDQSHYVEAIDLADKSAGKAMTIITVIIQQQGGKIVRQNQHYLAATFSSKLFGFIDDVEFRIDSQQQKIHLRSAARIGYSDFDVNRKRAVLLRDKISQQLNTN